MGRSKSRRRRLDLIELWSVLLIGVYLLFPGFSGFSGISMAKTWLFYGLMALLVFFGLALLIRDLRAGKGLGRPTGTHIAALVFLVCTLLSAAFSPYGSLAWTNERAHEAALTVSCYVLLFLTVSHWGRPTRAMDWVLLCSLTFFNLICLLQALGGNPLGLYPEGMNYYDGYVKYRGAYAGTLGNVDLVSAFFPLVIPLLLVPALGRGIKESWPRWVLGGVSMGILLWLRVLCGIVGLGLGGVLCLLILAPKKWRKPLWIGTVAAAVLALVLLWVWDPPVNFLHEVHEILHGRPQDSFGTGRFYIWRQMLERIPERLLLGIGPDAARFSGLQEFVRYDEAGNVAATATITDAHCYPLHILYCQGLPALLAWLAAVGQGIHHWVKHRQDRIVASLGAALVCFLAAMLFCFSSIILMPYYWLVLGLLEARVRELSDPKQVQPLPWLRESY